MKGKNLITLGLGITGGFIGGSVFVLNKVLKSERMRQASVDILADKVFNILFDDVSSANTNRKVHYYDCYNKPRRPRCYAVEGIVFDSRSDAEKVLDQMQELIDNYGCVRIQDYYDLCGVSTPYLREGKWGWITLNKVEIRKYRGGWYIDLPKAVPVM